MNRLQRTTIETDRTCADCGQRIGYRADVGWITEDGGICPAHLSGIHNHDSEPYGACGVQGCTDCRPLFNADNEIIPGTEAL